VTVFGGAAGLAFVFAAALILVIFLVVVVLAYRRDDPDPTGKRPYAAYVFFVSFLALFTVLFALFAMVGSLMHIAIDTNGNEEAVQLRRQVATVGSQSNAFGTSDGANARGSVTFGTSTRANPGDNGTDDADIRAAVRAGIVVLVAGAVLWYHALRARRLADDPTLAGSPAWRIYQAYLHAVCAFAVIVAVIGAIAVLYSLFRVLAPGIASSSGVLGKRTHALPDLVAGIVLTAGAAIIFLAHWQRSPGFGSLILGPPAALPPAPPEPSPATEPPPAPRPRRPRRPLRPE